MISVVIPTLNEAASLEQLHAQLCQVAESENYEIQMIVVDDGSTDNSWQVIEKLAQQDSRVLGIRFRRNFGKAAALSAGFNASMGEIIVTMDADLQDDPAEIPNLIARLNQGFDVVNGWKQERHDPWHKTWPSKVFNLLVSWMTGVRLHDHNCGLKCFRREVINEVRLYGELHRFVPVLAAARGFRVGEVVVKHRPRRSGKSKYGWSRIPKGLLDLLTVRFITHFNQRPQHWLGMGALTSLMLGILGMGYLAMHWCVSRLPGHTPIHLHETAALYYSLVLLLIGAQLLALGFVAELISALFSRDSDAYSIAEHTQPDKKTEQIPSLEVSHSAESPPT
ncbi:glycosyltransferase family 2 protein [Bythopirellula polymerisocia]|uniref:Undecaprenyl-phosphate 4-deoxy-4-formamido-L-arabinose transferase n=1 Tax=Bythopirellula polymerisocia TaxID=2528003 RepID=A0A5C6CTW9_9BACT|nr:glycosyltransferase family 2 protein [Bythopirellula polymerisocia]TWU28070.1 Undecaprenyl-phosphate 4-deoxy-4-formamido-L-arabinose transferase [Bythopirellula polymerisocia]